MMDKQSICVVIPAFNEEASIQKTLQEVMDEGFESVVVVDDGSTDSTVRIAEKMKVVILKLPYNLGAGIAFRKGLDYARRQKFPYAVQLDADGQHNPKDILKMVEAMKKNEANLVIGSRYVWESGYQTKRYGAIWFLSWVIQMKVKSQIYDPTSGFRLYDLKAMEFVCHNRHERYLESPMVAKLLHHGFVVREVPVTMRYRMAGKSKLTLFRGASYFLASLVGVLAIRKD